MGILNMSFNQLTSHLVCCTDQGYIIYAVTPKLEKKIQNDKKGGVGIMKMLNKTNIGVLVGGGEAPFKSKDTLVLWDDKQKKALIDIDLTEPILNVLINCDRIVAVIEKKICIFDYDGDAIDSKPTFCNRNGLCVMSHDSEKPILVTLGMRKGEIAIWRINQDSYKSIDAHQNAIEAIAINRDGSLIATASESGTLIKVFSTDNCEKKFEFRRGSTTNKVYDLAFNWDSSVLACCSANNGTIHIFNMNSGTTQEENTHSMLSSLSPYLPDMMGSSYLSSVWSAKQHYTKSPSKTICDFDETGVLHVASFDGKYYRVTGKNYEDILEFDLHLNG